jgi:hypothetical protein
MLLARFRAYRWIDLCMWWRSRKELTLVETKRRVWGA